MITWLKKGKTCESYENIQDTSCEDEDQVDPFTDCQAICSGGSEEVYGDDEGARSESDKRDQQGESHSQQVTERIHATLFFGMLPIMFHAKQLTWKLVKTKQCEKSNVQKTSGINGISDRIL